MKFSKKSEYGLRALIELTMNYGHPITRQQIGERQNVPVVFLEQILLSLKHAGLLASTRGAQGGYALIKEPSKVSLGQVIRILDGPLAPIACVSKTAYRKCVDCPYTKKAYCPLQHVMGGVRNAIADILDNYSLEDFISGMHGSRRSPVRRLTVRQHSEH
ncbi:MAG TPA: Rrf2 family transcriptional regulator [Casimicrobiaceae bacterium]|jgi:Rrf2 family cysteine metabolism transcriptional repressor|nr:Rrf2 family transcriptional regulator [Casimicrobiaceae bacterium]